MRTRIFTALTITLSLLFLQGNSQLLNTDKMSRAELREQLAIQLGKSDSLLRETVRLNIDLKQANSDKRSLSDEINMLSEEREELGKSIALIRRQVQGLEETIREKESHLRREKLRSDSLAGLMAEAEDRYNRELAAQREAKSAAGDSLRSQLESERRRNAKATGVSPENDFLTRYFRNPAPLNNTTLTFSLQKVIIGYWKRQPYEDPPESSMVQELTDHAELAFVRPEALALKTEISPSEFLKEVRFQDLNGELPALEFTRNKLVTIRYPDQSEESLMFNFVRESSGNGRIAGRFAMVAERTDLNDEEEKNRDIEWEVYAIGNQAFLALTAGQLERIGVVIREFDNQFMVVDKEYERVNYEQIDNMNIAYNRDRYYLAGKDHYLVRRQDVFMESAVYLNPDRCLFLFRLNQKEAVKTAPLKK